MPKTNPKTKNKNKSKAISKSKPKAKTKTKPNTKPKTKLTPTPSGTARPLAPEDVRRGDGVTVAYVTARVSGRAEPSFGHDQSRPRHERVIPDCAGLPLRVERVCLPFVFARNPNGRCGTLDLRRHTLFRLDEDYTQHALKELGPKKPGRPQRQGD